VEGTKAMTGKDKAMTRKNNKDITCKIALIVAILMFATSCTGGQTTGGDGYSATIIRVNQTGTYSTSIIQVLMLTGILEKHLPDDVTVEWTNVSSSPNIRDAMITGHIDIGTQALPSLISALENDFPITVLSSSVMQASVLFSARPDIQSVEDLYKADKIALRTIGSVSHLALMLVCQEVFGNARMVDDRIVAMGYEDMLASVETSDLLDCVAITFPEILNTERIDKLFPILDFSQISERYNLRHFIVTSDDFFHNNPALIEAFYQALREVVEFINEQPDETARLLAEFYGNIDQEAIVNQIKRAPPVLEISESAYDKIAELLFEIGQIDDPPRKFATLHNYGSIPRVP
jgi:NitT/TauT family transport system substrate-binding protein